MHDPLNWLVASVAIYALGSNLLWLNVIRPGDRARAVIRLAFYLGLPVLAMALRITASRDLGLPESMGGLFGQRGSGPWELGPSLGRNIVICLGLASLTALLAGTGRIWRARAWGEPLPAGPKRAFFSWGDLGRGFEQCLLQEVHWAFYRACLLSAGLAGRGLAVFFSLFVLGLEAWSSPSFRQSWSIGGRAERASQTSLLATLSALTFLLTGSSVWAIGAQCLSLLLLALAGLALPRPSVWPTAMEPPIDRKSLAPGPGAPARVPERAPEPPAEIEPTIV